MKPAYRHTFPNSALRNSNMGTQLESDNEDDEAPKTPSTNERFPPNPQGNNYYNDDNTQPQIRLRPNGGRGRGGVRYESRSGRGFGRGNNRGPRGYERYDTYQNSPPPPQYQE